MQGTIRITQADVLQHATLTASEITEQMLDIRKGSISKSTDPNELSRLQSEKTRLIGIAQSLSTKKDPVVIIRLAIQLEMSGARQIYTEPLIGQLTEIQKSLQAKKRENVKLAKDSSESSKDDGASYTADISRNIALINTLEETQGRIHTLLQLLKRDSYDPTRCLTSDCGEDLPPLRMTQHQSPHCPHCAARKSTT